MTAVYNIHFSPSPAATATLIEYRLAAAEGTWITPVSPPNPTSASVYPLELETGKTYYVAASAIGQACTRKRVITTVVVPSGPCCPAGFTMSPDSTYCFKEEQQPPTIETSGICLVSSKQNGAYGWAGAKIYNSGFGINLPSGNGFTLLTDPFWVGNPGGYADLTHPDAQPNESCMNRDAVWVDTNCDGTKDSLAACSKLQFSFLITPTTSKRVYIGMGGDNTFQLSLNNTVIVQCEAGSTGIPPPGGGAQCATAPAANSESSSNVNFNYWHIIPVDLLAGPNYLNFQAIGDGSINDAFAAIVYDNTAAQIAAATNESTLSILFRTGSYKGTSIDIATCQDGWTLDTSGGSGSYVCRRITVLPVGNC